MDRFVAPLSILLIIAARFSPCAAPALAPSGPPALSLSAPAPDGAAWRVCALATHSYSLLVLAGQRQHVGLAQRRRIRGFKVWRRQPCLAVHAATYAMPGIRVLHWRRITSATSTRYLDTSYIILAIALRMTALPHYVLSLIADPASAREATCWAHNLSIRSKSRSTRAASSTLTGKWKTLGEDDAHTMLSAISYVCKMSLPQPYDNVAYKSLFGGLTNGFAQVSEGALARTSCLAPGY